MKGRIDDCTLVTCRADGFRAAMPRFSSRRTKPRCTPSSGFSISTCPAGSLCSSPSSSSFIANVAYLVTRQPKWDWLGVAGVEVGVACSTIGLITGPIWAHPVWGIWWTWDARLTSTFVLWLLYISYLLLRGLLEDPAAQGHALRDFRHFRVPGCAAGLFFESPVAHAASAAGNPGRREFRASIPRWAKCCCSAGWRCCASW